MSLRNRETILNENAAFEKDGISSRAKAVLIGIVVPDDGSEGKDSVHALSLHGSAVNRLGAIIFLVSALVLIAPASAPAGQLTDFEWDATKKHQDSGSQAGKSTPDEKSSASGDLLSEAGDECIQQACVPIIQDMLGGLFAAIAAGGSQSLKRVEADGAGSLSANSSVRKSGEALLPFIRVDALYQNAEGDVSADDVRIEAGYGPLGFQIRRTAYHEKDPPNNLEITEYYVLYRMSAGNQWEIDIGAGGIVLSGMQNNQGFTVILPVLYHPSEFFGVEVRPAWATINENVIQDLDLAVLFGMRYVSVKAGYRWMKSPHQSLDGPEIGLAVRW